MRRRPRLSVPPPRNLRPVAAPAHVLSSAPQAAHFEDAIDTVHAPTFALGISHCPWRADRAEHMDRVLRPALYRSCVGPIHEETERAANHVWSRRLWGWGAAQAVSHVVYLQDDVLVAPDFWDVLGAVVRAWPRHAIALLGNHPMGPRAYAEGHPGYLCGETLGAGYVVPTPLMGAYLEWRDAQPEAWLAATCEDFVLTTWLGKTGRRAFAPMPSLIDTAPGFESTNPLISYPHRRSYLRWDSPALDARRGALTAPRSWRPHETLLPSPPDYGPSVSNDTRLPRGPFPNAAILAEAALHPRETLP